MKSGPMTKSEVLSLFHQSPAALSQVQISSKFILINYIFLSLKEDRSKFSKSLFFEVVFLSLIKLMK